MQLNLRPSCGSIVIIVVCALDGTTYASDQSQQQDKESYGPPPTAGFEQIERFAKQSPFYRASEPVGEIVITLKDGTSLPRCTGIVLSEDVVLTARHCFDDVEFAMADVTFLLDYRTVYSGVPHKMNLKPRDVGKAQQDDYMLLSAIDRFDVSKLKIPKIGDDPYPKQDLIIYHHPVGQTLMISLQGCRAAVEPTDGVALLHYCDTDKGSSGAPILDLEYNLVGIHVSGGRRPKEEASTNRGLLISEVLKTSPLLREVMARQPGTKLPAVAVAPPTLTKTYIFNDGKKITLSDGKWFYSESGGDDLGKNLTPQLGGGASQILWDSTTDSLFEIPKIGGPVRVKHGNDEWLAFGTVSVR